MTAAVLPRVSTRAAARGALLFVLPYLVLVLVWGMSNPPGAAPDESDHLVKTIGIGRLDIGSAYTGPAGKSLVSKRNASISRVVPVPRRLAPDGYTCTAFRPDKTAACLPTAGSKSRSTSTQLVDRVTPIGAYPPFLYLPAGLATDHFAHTPDQAFHIARAVFSVMAAALLFVGAFLLIRWLGPWSLLGGYAALTPMAVFSAGVLSTSGIEISGAFAVASAVLVVTRRPEAVRHPQLQVLLALSAAALVLSRQLGVVTLGVFMLVMLARLGPRRVLDLLRRPTRWFVGSVLTMLAACLALAWWELRFDHPVLTGPLVSGGAIRAFDVRALNTVRSGIGNFGWLDTPLPETAAAAWIVLVVGICAAAVLLGARADLWTMLALLVALVVVGEAVYASVFFPINAGLQGRHMLPLFTLLPLLAGAVLVERLQQARRRDLVRRALVAAGVIVGVVQLVAVYINAERYAVGRSGPLWFLGHSQWAPTGGWIPWLLLAALASLGLGAGIARTPTGPREPLPDAGRGEVRLDPGHPATSAGELEASVATSVPSGAGTPEDLARTPFTS